MEKIIDKNKSEDKKISVAIMSSFAILTIQYLILLYFNLLDTSIGKMVQIVSKLLVGFFYLIALPPVLRRNKIKFLNIYLISIFIFILNYVVFRENWGYLKPLTFSFFFTALPSFIYAYSINDWEIFMETMEKTGKLVLITGIVIAILVFIGNISVGSYSMTLSYYMLLPTILYMNKFLDKISLKNGIILLISLIVILALGSRGAIMCTGVFVILKLVKSINKITYAKIFLYLIIFSLTIVGILYFDKMLIYVYRFLLKRGINSRTIVLFLKDEVYLSGRDRIYEDVIKATLAKPLFGIGLAGDRVATYGYQSHNVFIEILANFGMVFGVFIVLAILYIVIKSLSCKETEKYNMITIWVSIGFVHLLVSSSYLIDFKFWIFIGLALSGLSNNIKN